MTKFKRKFLPELIGLAAALGAIQGNSPSIPPRPVKGPDEVAHLKAKRAEKLARRAKRAGF